MNEVLKHFQNNVLMVYMNDIINFSTSLQEHIQNLKLVFSKLREAHKKFQLDKIKEVQFLGHIITSEGIEPNRKKIEPSKNSVFLEFKRTSNRCRLRFTTKWSSNFIGLT